MKLKKIKSTKTRDIYDVPTSYHDYLLIRYEDEINNDIIEKWAELIDSPFGQLSNSDVEGKDFYWSEGLKKLLEKKGIKVPGPIETALVNPFCYTTDLGVSHSSELCGVKQSAEFKDHCHTQYKLNMIPIVYSVSGYLCDQMWKEYRRGKRVFGETLIPPNKRLLFEGEKLPNPVVVAMDKNSNGRHNNSLTYYERVKIISELTADEEEAIQIAKALDEAVMYYYKRAVNYARKYGDIIIANTKFEFGILPDTEDDPNRIMIANEILTPESTTFWFLEDYKLGESPESRADGLYDRLFWERICTD